jgi:hypothetical protein
MGDIYNQQFTIPYATNIEILTGSDFTIDSREKIYLADGKSSTRYVILFYREKDADIQKLRAIQKIFIETGKAGFQDVSFKVCNLSTDSKLNAMHLTMLEIHQPILSIGFKMLPTLIFLFLSIFPDTLRCFMKVR